MNLKINELKQIEKTLKLINYESLSEEEKKQVIDTDIILVNLYKRRKNNNEKTWKCIKEKRKNDPSYGRSKKEVEKMNNIKNFKNTIHIQIPYEDIKEFKERYFVEDPNNTEIINYMLEYLANSCDIVLYEEGCCGNANMLYNFYCNGGEYSISLLDTDILKLYYGKMVKAYKNFIYDYDYDYVSEV